MNNRTRMLAVAAVTTVFLLVTGPAFAHVTARVDNPAAEAFAKYTLRVPNEAEDAATVRVEVEMPDGFEEARYQPLAGWDIALEDGVLVIDGGRIEPGEFQEFAFSARNPAETGELTFPSIQIYEDGEEARWVGEADSDQPAPAVTIEPAEEGDEGGEGTEAAGVRTEPAAAPAEDDPAGDDVTAEDTVPTSALDDGGSTLTVIALIAGLLGAALGGAAFMRSGRSG